jgi:hypothetical protein
MKTKPRLSNWPAGFLIDPEDVALLQGYSVFLAGKGYAQVRIGPAKSRKYVYVHHLVLGGDRPAGMTADHINGNKMDNRRCNLRWATGTTQNVNRRIIHAKSGHRGICKWAPRGVDSGRWMATIGKGNQTVYRKYFDTIEEAVAAHAVAFEHIYRVQIPKAS